ncbi:hypothetical protein [Streptomyces sp. NTH33]|uniref:hypothetical protein n=1 Tax=Streptomyces sp. NTH33 TaxID=1735453 RepID=UPI0021AD263C|nr:hypothetical protein [Streptomyces sp. NTH33]
MGIGFAGSAPVRLVFAREVSASPERVFDALAEDVPGRTEWFSAVTYARPADGTAPFRLTLSLARRGPGRAFRAAVTSLDHRLSVR